MNALTVLSPAKVNVSLHIIRKRSDGYHDIQTILQKVSLYDEITLQIVPGTRITLTTDDPSIPTDSKNLAYQAAQLLLDRIKCLTGVSIYIKKRIPAGAGLGGGSSNAAATLTGVNALLTGNLSTQDLQQLGVALGADVPFFLCDYATACAEGIGERLCPVTVGVPIWFLIIFPGFSVSTAWAYRNYNILTKSTKHTIKKKFISDFKCLTSLLINDLEHVVIPQHPEIKRLKERLLESGASGSLMSGSGSSVFGIFPNEVRAQQALSALTVTEQQRAFLVRSL